MARTRRQVTLQQESGVPASPPQSLPIAARPNRAKRTTARNDTNNNNNNNDATAAPTDPPPSTRGGPAVRGSRIGRAKRIGRSRPQPPATINHDAPESSATDVDGTEASDGLIQTEVTVQATPTAPKVSDDHHETEHEEERNVESSGETQSPTSVSAHPVQVQGMSAHPVQVQDLIVQPVQVQDTTAHPMDRSTTPQERPESATSLKFRDVLNISPRSPSPSLGHPTPKVVTPTAPLNHTSQPSVEASSPAKVSSFSSSPLLKPIPQAPSPASPTPVFYIPSNLEFSHSLITIRMDHFQGSKDPVRPSKPAAFAVPSELVARICRFIESTAKQSSDLSKLTTDHPAVNAIVHGNARYRPQLPSWQSQQSPPIPGSTMRDAFIRRAQRKRGFREMEEETNTLKAENSKVRANAAGESNESPPKRTKMVPDPWTADGQLVLGRTKEIEVDESGVAINPLDEPSLRWNDMEERKQAQLDEARRIATVGESPYAAEEIPDTDGPALGGLFAESQEQSEPEQVPETPRARRWGFSNFLPSARSVTKYIPFSSRRITSTPQQPQQPPQQSQQLVQIETRTSTSSSQSQREPEAAGTVAGPSHRHRQPTSNQQRLLTKQQSEEEKKIKKMRAQLRREAEELEKQKRDLEIAKKDLAEQQKSADIAQTPGQKRKRAPSPDTIPLPASGGFGIVEEYFVVDSSSDEDLAAQETPTKERPLKKARTTAHDDAAVGSQFRARPYTGSLFAHPDAGRSRQDDNVFVEPNKSDTHPASDRTPPPGPTLIFKVPSPGSSDSDEDENDEPESIPETTRKAPSHNLPPPRSILRNSASNQSQPRPAANSTSPSKAMVPPPRPNPGHATLPVVSTMTSSDALEKAREKALRHQPKQPSTLRESSRLSTSTVNSDPGDEGNVEEYDPTNPAIVLSPSKVPVFGQPAPPVTPALGPPVVSPTAPTEFQQPVTQPASKQLREQPHEQQTVPKTSEKQADAKYIAAHADSVPLNSQAPVLAQEPTEALSDAKQSVSNMDQKIKSDLDRWWKEHGDELSSCEGYEDFQEDLLAEEQKSIDGPNGDPYTQPRNIISAALDRIGADGLSDRGIQTDIEDNWRPGDLERTESDPANGMRVFFNRLVKNGDIEKDLADRVIAMGVPPGITEYLAGQDVMGPVAA